MALAVKKMYFSAMTKRSDSPLPPFGCLTTGHFHMKRNYARWREHGAPGWLLIHTLSGRGRFGHAHGNLLTQKGDLVLLQPGTPNDYGLEEKLKRWELLWAYFFPPAAWLPLLQWPEISPGLMKLSLGREKEAAAIFRELRETHRLNIGPRRYREKLALNALEKALLLCDELNPRSAQSRTDRRILRAMDYLCENFSGPVPIGLLARHCGLSASRLAHLFREQVGQTPHQFLEIQRMTRARQMLELTQESVSVIAAHAGFSDPFRFSRRFKHHTGYSPRHYRRRIQLAMEKEGRRRSPIAASRG